MKLYFLAILPPENILEEIKHFKLEIAEKYAAKHALKLPAHITIKRPFKMNEVQEKDLVNSLNKFAVEKVPFEVKLKDFSSFPPRVIFVEVENKKPVVEFYNYLQQHLESNPQLKDQDEHFHPHLTVATRDLQIGKFSKAWEEFRNKKYRAAFKVDKFSLMKHNGKQWEIAENFFLRGN